MLSTNGLAARARLHDVDLGQSDILESYPQECACLVHTERTERELVIRCVGEGFALRPA